MDSTVRKVLIFDEVEQIRRALKRRVRWLNWVDPGWDYAQQLADTRSALAKLEGVHAIVLDVPAEAEPFEGPLSQPMTKEGK